ERGVERLVTDRDRAELDDLDPLVVREALAALRAFLLRGGGEAEAGDQRMTLDAAEVPVDVLDRRADALRPAGADEDLAALRVDRADDDRGQFRVGLALTADVGVVVRDGAGGTRAERDWHGHRERDCDHAEDDRESAERGSRSGPHGVSSLLRQ